MNKVLDCISWLWLTIGIVCFVTFFVGSISGLSLNFFMGVYDWSYVAVLEWSACFIVAWVLSWHQTEDALLSLTYSIAAISVGGMIHEVQYMFNCIVSFTPEFFYHLTYPLIINTQLLCFPLILILMREKKWKGNFLFWFVFTGYLVFTAFYVTVGFGVPRWLPRLPSIFLLCSIPLGFQKNSVDGKVGVK